jgi:hypothetical protein
MHDEWLVSPRGKSRLFECRVQDERIRRRRLSTDQERCPVHVSVSAIARCQSDVHCIIHTRASQAMVRNFTHMTCNCHGKLVCVVHYSDGLVSDWSMGLCRLSELSSMVERMNGVRRELVDQIRSSKIAADFSHIERQVGMFAFTGLTVDKVNCILPLSNKAASLTRQYINARYARDALFLHQRVCGRKAYLPDSRRLSTPTIYEQIRELQSHHHIYMSDDGRISIAGLSSLDVPRIVAALEAVLCRPAGMSF